MEREEIDRIMFKNMGPNDPRRQLTSPKAFGPHTQKVFMMADIVQAPISESLLQQLSGSQPGFPGLMKGTLDTSEPEEKGKHIGLGQERRDSNLREMHTIELTENKAPFAGAQGMGAGPQVLCAP